MPLVARLAVILKTELFHQQLLVEIPDIHGRNVVIKCGGGQLDIKPIKSSGLCGSEIM